MAPAGDGDAVGIGGGRDAEELLVGTAPFGMQELLPVPSMVRRAASRTQRGSRVSSFGRDLCGRGEVVIERLREVQRRRGSAAFIHPSAEPGPARRGEIFDFPPPAPPGGGWVCGSPHVTLFVGPTVREGFSQGECGCPP